MEWLKITRGRSMDMSDELTLEDIGEKKFLTIGDIDEIASYLGPEGWCRFKKMVTEKRVKFGLQILRKINKGV